ncbi:MAG TPA: NAD(P)H-dependent glycerol-3-phosphate dehydrogenase [Armatimonadota bacterium]|nr:NAD(P)H-dependent glycerol-3-phosphate dehydrogenase [Armatimonadota bacterium]
MTPERITVVGAGAWGTTLAALLARNGYAVRLWVRESEIVDAIRRQHENSRFLPGVTLPENLYATADMDDAAAEATLLVMATPSRWLRAAARACAGALRAPVPVVSVTKGLEIETGKRMSEVILEELPHTPAIAALSGPNLAPEIARGLPAATTIASADAGLAARAQRAFSAPHFRPYTGSDIVGLEVCGAMKNVIALAAGICEGLGFGHNAAAALLTRSMAEIARLVRRLGGQPDTVAGLSGIGDLIATCMSPISRNHRVGLALGRGQDARAALGDSGQVAEGVPTTEAVVRLARRLGVDLPICEQVYAILFDGRPAADAVRALMTRDPKSETFLG